MSDVIVKKGKIQKALDNGRAALEIDRLFAREQEEINRMLKEYEKASKIDFNLMESQVSSLVSTFNDEAKEVAELIRKFPVKRFLFFEDRLARKIKHNDSEGVPVTNTELFLIDALIDESFDRLIDKYKEKEHLVLNNDFHVKDLFTDADLKKAEGQHSLNILGIVVGVIAFIIVTWSQFGSG